MKSLVFNHRNKVYFLLLCLWGLHHISFGQIDIHQVFFKNPDASSLIVDLNEDIELSVRTHSKNEILITDEQGGEYKGAVFFNMEIKGNVIYLTDMPSPNFNLPDDKLSAHKVKDNKAHVLIPENLKVELYLRSAFLNLMGTYDSLYINQESGDCRITKLSGSLSIISIYAQVHASLPNYQVQASTKEGVIRNLKKKHHGTSKAVIEGVHGYIEVTD